MKIKIKKGLGLLITGALLFLGVYNLIIKDNLGKDTETATKVDWDTQKADKPDEYAKLYNELRTRYSETTSGYGSGYRTKELRKAGQNAAASRLNATYVFDERGPSNVPGRTRAIIVDPDNAISTWFAGSVGGGVWKTTDSGQTWVNKMENLPNLAISWLAMAESNHDIIYAGTGEARGGFTGIKGSGIYKSTNRGDNWTLLTSTTQNDDFQMVNRIVVDPSNPDIIVVSTSNDGPNNGDNFDTAILKSIDGGTSWTRKFTGISGSGSRNGWIQQVVATPGDFNTLYATSNSRGVYKSVDAGETWSLSSSGLLAGGRIEIAVSPINPSRIFASTEGGRSGNSADLYISDDSATSWELVTEEFNGENFDFLGGQGGYDNTIMAHPFDADIVYAGGVDIFKIEMKPGTVLEEKQFNGAEEQNTGSFLSLLGYANGVYYDQKIGIGSESQDQFVSIEVRFGPDGNGSYLKQMAHRYTIPVGLGSGVPTNDYAYQDYVEVPFQVWDTENNRQLMVGFRDQQDDGVFNLLSLNTDNADALNNSREYLYINNITYNEVAAESGMAVAGGQEFKNLYFLWPYLSEDGQWDETNLPASKFIINFGEVEKRLKKTTPLSDSRNQFGGSNGFPQTQGSVNQAGLHPDHHNLLPIITNQAASKFQILNANDGGVYHSNSSTNPGEDNGDWTLAAIGYNTSQFYAIDKAPGESRYVGGLQDNGSWMSQPGEEGSASAFYQRANSGDGFGVAWNHSDPNLMITTVYNNFIGRSSDGGATFSSGTTGLSDVGGGLAPFVTEVENLHSDPEVVFTAGVSGVWRSTNFANSWQLSAIKDQWSLASTMKVRISHANSHIVWAGVEMNEDPKISLHVSMDEGVSFLAVNNFIDVELGRISGLATHPVLDSTAFALFSFAKGPKILRTDNLGQSWYDISGFGTGTVSTNGFPDVALFDLLVMPYDTTIIWAGTEIGVFESTDAGSSWHIVAGNMPATAIWDMKIVDKQIILGTHGRGIWSTTIDELPGQVYLPEITSTSSNDNGELVLEVNMQSSFDSTYIYVDGSLIAKLIQPNDPGNLQIITDYNQLGQGIVHIRSFYRGVPYVSHIKEFLLSNSQPAVDSYENDFSIETGDFTGNGFSEKLFTGFPDMALHSDHPYGANSNLVYALTIPIRVRAVDALINFREVVIVEPAINDPTKAGDNVVIQGSLDGISWVDLVDEYDASNYDVWNSTFKDKLGGSQTMYKFRSINLLTTFKANDEIFIRFKLSSDEDIEGWGWVIDDLKIQTIDVITGVDLAIGRTKFSVYPNPIHSNLVTVEHLTSQTSGTIQLIDLDGRLILEEQLGISGSTEIDIPSHVKNGIYFILINNNFSSESQKVIIQR